MLTLIDKEKFKAKVNIYLRGHIKNIIIVFILALTCTILVAGVDNNVRYNNQFYYAYVILLMFAQVFAQASILYGEIMKSFLNFKFSRKEYYLENTILVTIFSLIISIMFFGGVVINMFYYKRNILICMWFKFNNVNFITYIQAFILILFVINAYFMLGHFILILCIGKSKVPSVIAMIILVVAIIYLLVMQDSTATISPWIISHNTSYSLYLISVFVISIFEYFVGREVFLRKDIV